MAEKFVEMLKDGVHLVVHPSTVKAHQRAGWVVVKEVVAVEKHPVVEEKTVTTAKTTPPPARAKK